VAVIQEPASKYLIIEKKHPQEYGDTSRQFSSYQDSHYMTKSPQKLNLHEEEDDLEPRQGIAVQPTRFKAMAETRAEDAKPHKEELYYSESEEDSSYA
jgi:hypothetical protein